MSGLIKRIKSKLIHKSGETLTETLVALLIIIPALTMLAGAMVASAKINRSLEDGTGTEAVQKYLPRFTENQQGTFEYDGKEDKQINVYFDKTYYTFSLKDNN